MWRFKTEIYINYQRISRHLGMCADYGLVARQISSENSSYRTLSRGTTHKASTARIVTERSITAFVKRKEHILISYVYLYVFDFNACMFVCFNEVRLLP